MTNADISSLEATLVRMIDASELRYIETRNGIARYEIINTEGKKEHDDTMATDARRLPPTDAATT